MGKKKGNKPRLEKKGSKKCRTPIDNSDLPMPCGLGNLGNTCFLNSILQCLNVTPLRSLLENGIGPITRSLWNTLDMMANNRSHRPSELLYALGEKFPWYTTRRQQDAHEVLCRLLSSVADENGSKNDVARGVEDLFGGAYVTLILCTRCLVLRSVPQQFMDLSLNVEHQDVKVAREILERFDEEETVTVADMKWHGASSSAQEYVTKLIRNCLKPQHVELKMTRREGEKWGYFWNPKSIEKKKLVLDRVLKNSAFGDIPVGSTLVSLDGIEDISGIRHVLSSSTSATCVFQYPFEEYKGPPAKACKPQGTKVRMNVKRVFPVSSKFAGHTFHDSLRQFTQTEALSGDNQYHCDVCSCRTDSIRRMILREDALPPVLCVQLNRFAQTYRGGTKNTRALNLPTEFKLPCGISQRNVEAPLEPNHNLSDTLETSDNSDHLDVSDAEGRQLDRTPEDVEDAALSRVLKIPSITVSNNRYMLSAFAVHQGNTVDSGHYVAYVRRDDEWFCASDNNVSKSLNPPYGDAYVAIYTSVMGDSASSCAPSS